MKQPLGVICVPAFPQSVILATALAQMWSSWIPPTQGSCYFKSAFSDKWTVSSRKSHEPLGLAGSSPENVHWCISATNVPGCKQSITCTDLKANSTGSQNLIWRPRSERSGLSRSQPALFFIKTDLISLGLYVRHLHVGRNNTFYIDLRSKAEMWVYQSQMDLICFYWVRDRKNNLGYLRLTQHAVMKVKKVGEHWGGLSKWQMHKHLCICSTSKTWFLTFPPNESWEMLHKKNWIHISSWSLILLVKELTDRCILITVVTTDRGRY